MVGVATRIERQFDRPIVGQVETAPARILEAGAGRAVAIARLGEEEGTQAVTEVLARVIRVPVGEAPILVDIDPFARRLRQRRRQREGRGSPHFRGAAGL